MKLILSILFIIVTTTLMLPNAEASTNSQPELYQYDPSNLPDYNIGMGLLIVVHNELITF